MSFTWNRFYIFLSVFMLSTQAQAVHNPVLDFVADAGVMRYNGAYYLMGVNTAGQMYVSR